MVSGKSLLKLLVRTKVEKKRKRSKDISLTMKTSYQQHGGFWA